MSGHILVVLQCVCLAVLAWPWSAVRFSVYGTLLLLAGAALGAWTLAFNRIGNFNIHPAPRAGALFVTRGPYRYIRHPMYAAVLISGAGVVFWYGTWQKAASWLGLGAVLYLKSRVEELALRRVFPGYATYAQHTQRFIPFIF